MRGTDAASQTPVGSDHEMTQARIYRERADGQRDIGSARIPQESQHVLRDTSAKPRYKGSRSHRTAQNTVEKKLS